MFVFNPVTTALGVLALGEKVTPADGVTVQVPVSNGEFGVLAESLYLPAQIFPLGPVVAVVGTPCVTITSISSLFAGQFFPPDILNRIL